MQAVGKSHIGKVRLENQDAIYTNAEGLMALPNLFVVADGLGGHSAGDIASNRAMATFCDFFDNHKIDGELNDSLTLALEAANLQVYEDSCNNRRHRGMGTTFSAASILDGFLHYVHVGDSRIYAVDKSSAGINLIQLTNDHFSYTADMVAEGLLTEAEAEDYPESVLTRAIGTDPDVTIDKGKVPLSGVSFVLLCSDGLTNMVSNDDILGIINGNGTLEEKAEALIGAALAGGGLDNISVILITTD
ncbi:MAG: protein phosphatase 2C domain-containing protein [Defluviitaleaceae bacterium]|nr:protein phosphatase 2C domain-containing protein [Defluviitaleaceae bacterium]